MSFSPSSPLSLSLSFLFSPLDIKIFFVTETLEKKQINRMLWSPRGQFIVLAGIGSPMNGVLEFWNTRDPEMLTASDHLMCADVEWDPSGRYVISSVPASREKVEPGYNLWDFQGKLLFKVTVGKFHQILWRPRPQTLLSKSKIADIKKNMAKYSTVFSKADDALSQTCKFLHPFLGFSSFFLSFFLLSFFLSFFLSFLSFLLSLLER